MNQHPFASCPTPPGTRRSGAFVRVGGSPDAFSSRRLAIESLGDIGPGGDGD